MVQFFITHQDLIAEGVLAVLAIASVIVRLTPTKTDDGVFSKVDTGVNKVFDLLKLPNKTKKSLDSESK